MGTGFRVKPGMTTYRVILYGTIDFMTTLSSLSFLIPAFNDEATIEKVVHEAVAVGRRVAKKFEIVVINDGSQDMTGPRLVSLVKKFKELRVITHRTNQGYGRTIKELYYAGNHDWLFTIPGDYQVGAKELETILERFPELNKSQFRESDKIPDMILGWRVKRNDPTNRLLSSWIYNTLLRLLFGVTLHDVNSVRLMRRSILKNMTLTSYSAFVDAELVIRAKRLGFLVSEVPVVHRARSDDRPGGGNQWGTMWGTVREMILFSINPKFEYRNPKRMLESLRSPA
ncbi:glycosyltransferase family 2 protein [Candidatus Gottesmanbacteria bacterium]|nr:glycosyltransferase family 2 protein [Candidatus Gottesmanbacteria bacterium]